MIYEDLNYVLSGLNNNNNISHKTWNRVLHTGG